MTTRNIETTTSHGIEGFLADTMHGLARRWRSAMNKQEHLDLDDRTLEDIGLTREDVRIGRRPPRA